MFSLGVDIGAYAVKTALLDEETQIKLYRYVPHKGGVKPVLKEVVQDVFTRFDPREIAWGAVTGSGAEWLTETGAMNPVNHIQALVEGARSIRPDVGSIVEIGSQSAKYVTGFSQNHKSGIKISINSSCSAGTGSFLEEQLSRLNLKMEDYSALADRARSIPRIAGRCSVFAKTDITHHQQWGTPVEDILLGLAYAVVRNYRGAIMKKLPQEKPILFAGGVAANITIVRVLEEILKLGPGELIVPDNAGGVGALGAALAALRERLGLEPGLLADSLDRTREFVERPEEVSTLPRLASLGNGDSLNKHSCPAPQGCLAGSPCYLGVDVGSTSTNLVLCRENNELVAFKYLRTLGNPVAAVSRGLGRLWQELGPEIRIAGVGITGSGRYLIGEVIGADVIKDEITAQAKAATVMDGEIDTVFEIGGQDSKFIRLDKGAVTDFQMNKVCAAGTGSFLEEQAHKFNIAVDDLGEIALYSNNPVNLGERCTVFIESSIAAHLSQGAGIEDIASGLCYSIAKNYLNRVVGQKSIGRKISFQGGVAYNQGVVNAFRVLTGKRVQVPPFFSVSGAYGAAVLAREEMGGEATKFKGFQVREPERSEKPKTSPAPFATNSAEFDRQVDQLVFKGYDGSRDPARKTVGLPRALFTYGMFCMFHPFFKELGLNVILSDPSSEKTVQLGQEYSLDETCYPVKLINGHLADLLEKKVDYIFFPDLYTVMHPGSKARRDYGCPYMQLAFKLVKQAMELEDKEVELLAPTIGFTLGHEFMINSFARLGRRLGKPRSETLKALKRGMESFHNFEDKLKQRSQKVIREIKPDEMTCVLISKIYGVADPVLNMGIPGRLMDLGFKVISFFDLPEGDISPEHPNMYWPFGQHILESARIVRRHPNLYAVLLTHHGCGPDSVITHFFREIMGDKPYLHIEVDEHSSDVGVITRVEAFASSLRQAPPQKAEPVESYVNRTVPRKADLKTRLGELGDNATLYLPHLYPYAQIFRNILTGRGVRARILQPTDRASLELGRKHTMTNEYLSLTALLGDVLKRIEAPEQGEEAPAFLIPQNEGAEVDGQYSRLLRTVLDEKGLPGVEILTPFVEDSILGPPAAFRLICLGLLAGDVVLASPAAVRQERLAHILALIEQDRLDMGNLKKVARLVGDDWQKAGPDKTVLALGEPFILHNDFLNDRTFRRIEESGHRVVYGPLSEYMWLLWRDFAEHSRNGAKPAGPGGLADFKADIEALAVQMGEGSPFALRLEDLIFWADKVVGYYAGNNGRYRLARRLCQPMSHDGTICAASIYENTGIALGVLARSLENGRPTLELTFDGNRNETNKAKVDSFIHFL